MSITVEKRGEVVIKFAGDSGDGMQLTGGQFTNNTALVGNDIATFPDFPAEIRAPAGTLAGVSGFQLHFADKDIFTPGDNCDVLVAMNAAALKTNLRNLKKDAIIIANTAGFDSKNLRLSGYGDVNPLEDNSLDSFRVHAFDVTKLTRECLKDFEMGTKEKDRSKNMFVLGFIYWMFSRKIDSTLAFFEAKFAKKPTILEANKEVLQAGYNFGETTETFTTRFEVDPATLQPGTYRSIMGNEGIGMGMIAASVKSGLQLFLGSYPITPASDILHYLARHKNFGPMPRYSALVHGLCPLVIMGYFEKAFELADSIAEDVERVLFASPLVAEHTLYYGLAAAATAPFCQPKERRRRHRIAALCHRKMRRWASFCASNFEHKERLLAAELERAKGHSIRAMARYEEAVQSCREHGFPHLEALCTERLAAVLVDEEWGHLAKERLEQSYELYAAWGARVKVAALARQYPRLLASPAARRRRTATHAIPSPPSLTTSDAFDLSTLMKASEAISREIRIDDLLQRLIALIIENTGAERGALIVDHNGDLIVEIMGAIAGAAGTESNPKTPLLPQEAVALAQCQHLATATVRYASRTQEVVLWHAADGQHRFDSDAYIASAEPKAILCFPIMYQDGLFGIIYLENTLSSHAFTDEHLEVLRLLSAR